MLRLVAIFVSTVGLCLGAHAATVTAAYLALGGSNWSAEFNVVNDGSPATISGFTIYFPEGEFSSLALKNGPTTWDSLVVQPDLGLPAAGFLDSLAILPVDELALGQTIGGIEIEFTFLGQGTPGSLAFDIVDRNFQVIFTGLTVGANQPPNGVPEPAPWELLLAAMMALAAFWRPRSSPTSSPNSVQM